MGTTDPVVLLKETSSNTTTHRSCDREVLPVASSLLRKLLVVVCVCNVA
jgi:hypothetical protein